VSKKIGAAALLGGFYAKGLGVHQDYAEAVKWWHEAAERGFDEAQYVLGTCYTKGRGVTQNDVVAYMWLNLASQTLTDARLARDSLGRTMAPEQIREAQKLCQEWKPKREPEEEKSTDAPTTRNMNPNQEETAEPYLKAAAQGDAEAQYNLGRCHEKGLGLSQDYEQAATWYRKAAKQGHAAAQYSLGLCYGLGSGVPEEDSEQAAMWLRRSAEQGYPGAQWRLGACYKDGDGVPKDDVLAHMWLSLAGETIPMAKNWRDHLSRSMTPEQIAKAQRLCQEWKPKQQAKDEEVAEQGDAEAQLKVARYYYCKKDYAEAIKWFRRAAEQEQADAQVALGNIYFSGEAVPKDAVEAVTWHRKAAEQGNADGQSSLGACYALGAGVTKDDVEAVKWLKRAAEQGHAGAQMNLSSCYKLGKGVCKDDVQAYMWLNLAGQTNAGARILRDELSKEMSPQQIVEAQELAREWKRQRK
jgi:TPR repeat protein